MSSKNDRSPLSTSVLATVFFTQPDKPLGYGHGFVVRFAVAPRVGDALTVDQYSIRKIPQEALHQCHWQIVQVEHELNLDAPDDGDHALATLRVTAYPRA